MVCNFCGKENADDAVFCKACGNRLVSEEAPEELYTENISEEEYAESEEYASYAADSTENSVIVCANCGAANPAGDAFCGKCGKPFVSVCPKCGAKLADGQRFCGACGFGAVAAIIALLAAPLANAVIKSETGFDIKALSAEATPWVLLVLCVLAFVLKKFVFDKLAEKAES